MPAIVEQTGADWKFGLFGCFEDTKLCILTFLLPCYTAGKNAESLGENCLLHGLLSAVGLFFEPVTRWRIRQERKIQGSMLMDVLAVTVCPCCAMIQEAREVGYTAPKSFSDIGREGNQDQPIERE